MTSLRESLRMIKGGKDNGDSEPSEDPLERETFEVMNAIVNALLARPEVKAKVQKIFEEHGQVPNPEDPYTRVVIGDYKWAFQFEKREGSVWQLWLKRRSAIGAIEDDREEFEEERMDNPGYWEEIVDISRSPRSFPKSPEMNFQRGYHGPGFALNRHNSEGEIMPAVVINPPVFMERARAILNDIARAPTPIFGIA